MFHPIDMPLKLPVARHVQRCRCLRGTTFIIKFIRWAALTKVLHQSKASRIRQDNKSILGKKGQTKNGSRANRGQINQAIGAARHHDFGTSLHRHNDIARDHIFSPFQLLLTNSE